MCVTFSKCLRGVSLGIILICDSAIAADLKPCFGQAVEQPRSISKRQGSEDEQTSRGSERKQAGLQALMESVRLGQQRLTGIEKARLLLDASEALWPVDAEQARSVVKLAWDAALKDDSARSLLEPDATLARILGSLSVHDVLLAEKLRSTLPDKERQRFSQRSYQFLQDHQFGGEHGSGSKHWTVVGTAIDDALAAGKSEMAIDAVRKVMADGYNDDLVSFLSYLRQRLPEAADRMYLELVHRNWFSPFVPPAEVVVLSSYLFTPGIVYLLSTRNGGVLSIIDLPLGFGPAPQDVDPEVRRAFYEMAAKAFLAPEPMDEKVLALPDIAAYRTVTVLAINKLLPHFELEAPEYVPALRARVDSLSRWAPLNPKDWTEPMMARVLSDPNFGRYDHGAGPTERDDAYYEREALLFATHGQFDRARESGSLIRNDEGREKTLTRVNLEDASRALQRGAFERVLEIVSTEELPEATEVSLLAAAARGVAKQDEGLAASVFAEARQKAEKAEDAGLQVRLFAELAISALAIGSNQSWECLELAIGAFARKEKEEAEKDREKAASGPVDSQLRTAVRRFGKVDSEKTMFAIDSVKSARLRPWLMLSFAKALLEN